MEYEAYLEKVLALVQKKFFLGQQRLKGEDSRELAAEILEDRQRLYEMENVGMRQEDFWAMAYLLRLEPCLEFERHLIFLLFFQALRPECSAACRVLNGRREQGYVTPKVAVLTFEQEITFAECYVFLFQSSLLSRIFLESDTKSGEGMERKLLLNDRILYLMVTKFPVYPLNQNFIKVFYPAAVIPDFEDEEQLVSRIKNIFLSKDANKRRAVYQIYGASGAGKKTFLAQLSAEIGREIVLLSLDDREKRDWQEYYDEWYRECFLWDALPALEISEQCPQELAEVMLERICREYGDVFLLSEKRETYRLKEGFVLSFALSECSLQRAVSVWKKAGEGYQLAEDVLPEELAGKFLLTPGKIRKVYELAEVLCVMEAENMISSKLLHQACYGILESGMKDMAQKVECHYHWEDIVLPEGQRRSLRLACNQVKYRNKVYVEWGMEQILPYGKGVSMLFSGPPGTGKTMAAQVVAAELEMELYRVALPAVVSKYIGDTEKNLNEIFEQAKKSQVILFFDEADVLFSKRTEIKDSNDRYSNMEAAFLLQKMEEYEGVTILASNYQKNFDEAFKRRIKFVIDFPFPDEEGRREIWKKSIPPQIFTSDIDLAYLSRSFELSGSNIKNIVLHAAFLAAASGEKLGMKQLLEAVRNEYAKLGKSLTAKEMGEYFMF